MANNFRLRRFVAGGWHERTKLMPKVTSGAVGGKNRESVELVNFGF